MSEIDVPYLGGPLDGEVALYDDERDPIDEHLAKGLFVQYEEHYDPRTPGMHPVHRYDLRRDTETGELELRHAGIMRPGTFVAGRVENFAYPDAEVEDLECE